MMNDGLKKGLKEYNKRGRPVGKLSVKDEKIARRIANPVGFGEIVLGFEFCKKQKEALEACMPEGCLVTISAANGGGKTSRIIPTLVLWHQCLWPSGKVKVTSGSYPQIEHQVWPNINLHKDRFPNWKWLETPYFSSKHPNTGRKGFFVGFKTNEPGKAEGDHADCMNEVVSDQRCPLMFIVDEAKTAPIWLRGVLEARVRPTRLILMSSHGFAEGWFYETHRLLDGWKRINISADDCPWISKEEIAQVRKTWIGMPEFADSVLGVEFMPMIADSVINGRALDEAIANPPAPNGTGGVHAFCDFAWGGSGDLNVIAMRRGNLITIEDKFHCGHLLASNKNPTPGLCELFIANFTRMGFSPGNCGSISGDEGGGGKLVMDALDTLGWVLNRVNNGGTPCDDHYANVGAEMWYEFGKGLTMKQWVLPNDQLMRGQFLNRKRMIDQKGKLKVESKEDMKNRGVPSPDVADAVAGCAMPSGGFLTSALTWAMPVQVGRFQTMGAT